MKTFLKSVLIGVVSAIALGILLAVIFGVLFAISYPDVLGNFGVFGIIVIYITPLLFGGYIGGRFANSLKTLVGFIVGLILIWIYSFITTSYPDSFEKWMLLIPVFGGLLGSLGALLSYNQIGTTFAAVMMFAVLFVIAYTNFTPSGPDSEFREMEFSVDDQEIMNKLKQALNDKSIDFQTYTKHGEEYIGYSKEDKNFFEEIRYLVMTGRPKGYEQICSDDEDRTELMSQRLKDVGIHTLSSDRGEEYGGYSRYCLAWPEEHNGKVAELDSRYKYILERQKQLRENEGVKSNLE